MRAIIVVLLLSSVAFADLDIGAVQEGDGIDIGAVESAEAEAPGGNPQVIFITITKAPEAIERNHASAGWLMALGITCILGAACCRPKRRIL